MRFPCFPFLFLVFVACATGQQRVPTANTERPTPTIEDSSELMEQVFHKQEKTAGNPREQPTHSIPTETCLQEILRGLLQCQVQFLDVVDGDDAEALPDCVPNFQRGIEATRDIANNSMAGLGTAMAEQKNSQIYESKELSSSPENAKNLGCMASAVLWRSLIQPNDIGAARSVPIALKIIEGLGEEDSRALFGLPIWTRAVLFSQTPVHLGGNQRAEQDFKMGAEMAGPLAAYVYALQMRYLCTAKQELLCAQDTENLFRQTPAAPEIFHAGNRLVQWVKDRQNLLFPNAPLTLPPPPQELPAAPDSSMETTSPSKG